MKRNKGFTLIELLAVVVILGLLMAIAIPSVTRYITNSRKKTLATTIGNYVSALTNDVNNGEYRLTTKGDSIYAIPIECISLERGGTNPFGEWSPANPKYWAYVLVQYDDETSSYTYGFTFKDNAGYGMLPVSIQKLDTHGKQITTGLDLKQPIDVFVETRNGEVIEEQKEIFLDFNGELGFEARDIANRFVVTNKWSGFKVDDTTNFVVYGASENGDGVSSCSIADATTVKKMPKATCLGDADSNGRVDSTDYERIKGHILGNITLDAQNLVNADTDKDGKITANDYLNLKKTFLGEKTEIDVNCSK